MSSYHLLIIESVIHFPIFVTSQNCASFILPPKAESPLNSLVHILLMQHTIVTSHDITMDHTPGDVTSAHT